MLVFGLDFLGNPVGLVKDLGGGVKDLFYEPYQGAIQGPEEFVEGDTGELIVSQMHIQLPPAFTDFEGLMISVIANSFECLYKNPPLMETNFKYWGIC